MMNADSRRTICLACPILGIFRAAALCAAAPPPAFTAQNAVGVSLSAAMFRQTDVGEDGRIARTGPPLSRADRVLVDELVRRGMPELVAAALKTRHASDPSLMARAWVNAALEAEPQAARDEFFGKADAAFEEVVQKSDPAVDRRDLRRRFEAAQRRVEWADMIVRHWIVPDLDHFELTSGLVRPPARLEDRLRKAWDLYTKAGALLLRLREEQKDDTEDVFLLTGLDRPLRALEAGRDVNASWTAVYLASVLGPEDPMRTHLLEGALYTFEHLSRDAADLTDKYNHLMGVGLSLRGLGRLAEASDAFDRIILSTALPGLIARARYEKVRALLALNRFDLVRRTLGDLDAQARKSADSPDEGAFYFRQSPLLWAQAAILERRLLLAEGQDAQSGRCRELEEAAQKTLAEVANRGGTWAEIAGVYLDALAGGPRPVVKKTAAELRAAAKRLMANGEYGPAADLFDALLSRPADGGDAGLDHDRFQLGVCRFKVGDFAAAATAFDLVAARKEGALAAQAAEYALGCAQRAASASPSPEAFIRLASAAERLAGDYPDHRLADQAGWTAAAALEQAERVDAAERAYSRIGPSHPRYWASREAIARLRERRFESLPEAAPADERRRLAWEAERAWLELAEAMRDAGGKEGDAKPPSAEQTGGGPTEAGSTLVERSERAFLSAAELLAGGVLDDTDASLRILNRLPASAHSLRLRIRCHRRRGELSEAQAALDAYLAAAPQDEAGGVLLGLAADMETEVNKLESAGRADEARQAAARAVETIGQLLTWVDAHADYRQHRPTIQFSLAKALSASGEWDEALALLDELIAAAPASGDYLMAAAKTCESAGRADRAADYWGRLLTDESLRERAPKRYWEARYHWLKHRLRQGAAIEVARAIETEAAWFPNLGGPPWGLKLRALADDARAKAPAGGPASKR